MSPECVGSFFKHYLRRVFLCSLVPFNPRLVVALNRHDCQQTEVLTSQPIHLEMSFTIKFSGQQTNLPTTQPPNQPTKPRTANPTPLQTNRPTNQHIDQRTLSTGDPDPSVGFSKSTLVQERNAGGLANSSRIRSSMERWLPWIGYMSANGCCWGDPPCSNIVVRFACIISFISGRLHSVSGVPLTSDTTGASPNRVRSNTASCRVSQFYQAPNTNNTTPLNQPTN